MALTHRPLIANSVSRAARLSTRHAWVVIALFLMGAGFAGVYAWRHLAITTNSSKLLSSSLPWRQQEIRLNALFPQRTDRVIAVVDATTAEGAEEAASALTKALQEHRDIIRTATRPDGGDFFARNGILFRSVDDVKRDTAQLIKAEPFLATLAADPTLRGVLGAISQSIDGIHHGKTTLENIEPALAALSELDPGRVTRTASALFVAKANLRKGARGHRTAALREHPAGSRL